MDLDDYPIATNLLQYLEETKAFGGLLRCRQDQPGKKLESWYLVETIQTPFYPQIKDGVDLLNFGFSF